MAGRNFGNPSDGTRVRDSRMVCLEGPRPLTWAEEIAERRKADAFHRDAYCILGVIVFLAFCALIWLGVEAGHQWTDDQVISDGVRALQKR